MKGVVFTLTLVYYSEPPFSQFARGLLTGCIQHFGEAIDLSMEDLSAGLGNNARFDLNKQS
jgi:hypothetical protein